MRFDLANRALAPFNNLKINQKLLAIYVLAFLIPLGTVTVVLAGWLYRTLEHWQLEQAQASVSQTAILFRDMLQSAEKLSDSLFLNRAVQETLDTTFTSSQEVYDNYLELAFLDDFLRANGDVASFRYYTENPTLLNNAYFLKATQETRAALWYQDAKESRGCLRWVIKEDTVTRKRMLSLTRAVLSGQDGHFLGVLSINLNPDRITRLLMSHEKETLVVSNGTIEFSSRDLPQNLHPEYAAARLRSAESRTVATTWNGENVVAILNSLYREPGTALLLVQIIPRKELLTTTLRGIGLCLSIMVAGSLVSLLLIILFSRYFKRRVSYVNGEIKKVVQNNFELGPRPDGTDEFAEMYDAFVATSQNIRKLIAEVYQHKIEQEQLLSRQSDIRFKMLASQINPHFLFNTLETIRMQAFADGNRDVAHTIKLLAKILRHNLDVTDRPVPLMEELEAVSNYLDIQHLRFADRVSYDIIFLSDVRTAGILPLLMQPLVENAFMHGLESRRKGGFIYITIDSDAQKRNLYISIQDNGCGIPPDRLREMRERLAEGAVENFTSSIGMVNVNQRIKLFYGSQYGLSIASELEKGTTVTLHVPAVPAGGEKGEGHHG